jgi:hypothetical protein
MMIYNSLLEGPPSQSSFVKVGLILEFLTNLANLF